MSLDLLQSAVVADLISGGFAAEKSFIPEITLKSGESLRVLVAPMMVETQERQTRGNKWNEDLKIQIGVVQRTKNQTEIEAVLEGQAEAIRDRYKNNPRITDTASGIYTMINILYSPYYDYDELDEDGQVVSIIEVRFRQLEA